jgi:formate dehydrogenase major subunit
MVELKACAINVEKLPEKLEMKGEVYKDGTDTEIKAENMSTTTVTVGK